MTKHHKIQLGEIYNRLTVIRKEASINGIQYWVCRCVCGNLTVVKTGNLRSGQVKSCGCAQVKHGFGGTHFYDAWYGMFKRKRHNIYYINVKIYEPWSQFENFYNDMYKSYLEHAETYGESNTTLDRIKDEEGYHPGNCRWLTKSKNASRRKDIS